jgi:glucosamine-6-phosphate deaminase
MTSRIPAYELFQWCRIPVSALESHPARKVPLRILDTPDEVHRWTAHDMLEEVKANNRAGRPTRWILPCGPTKQYPYFVSQVNAERVSLRNVHVFHMDDNLDWQGRPLALDHQFSYEGWMNRHFYDPVDPDLAIPIHQRHFPSIYDIDGISRAIQAVGGVDTTYGGIGYRGHIAFNEPPRSPWYTVSPEEFRNSMTRILHLNEDTLIALSQRATGGCSHAIPPMAITMGMKDLLSARRIRLISDTGAWKRTVIRYLLFGPTSIEYPVSFVQGHPDVLVVVDHNTALPPLGEE